MATLKHKDASPYSTPAVAPFEDDFVYTRYLSAVNLDPALSQNTKKFVIALFGAGRAGTFHLTNLTTDSRVKIAYVVDDLESKWEPTRKYWNLLDTKFLTSKQASQVYDDATVDAVIVASPTHTHEGIVRNALNSKKAVLCEKPLAGDRDTVEDLYNLAKKVGKPLFCAFNRRFDPSFSTLRKDVRAGKVGHVHTIKVCSRDCPIPNLDYLRISGGIFHDCAIHDIDMMIWILGELPSKVFAMGSANIPEIGEFNDFDTVAMTLKFPSGTLGIIDVSRNATFGYDQRVEVFGPRGMVQCNNERPMDGYETHTKEGLRKTPAYYCTMSRHKQGYAQELEHFMRVLEGKEKMSVHPQQTLAASKVASALELSAKTGKYVDLNWKPHEQLPEDA